MLCLREIHFQYPRSLNLALAGVSFDVERGEILGLLGPNGAGKSTLISQLAGILPIQRGTISIDGELLQQSRKKTPWRIALAPQEYAFYPTLTVKENLEFFAAMSSKKKQNSRIPRALALTQLEQFAGQTANTLSGGLKRRLNLAIATLSDPEYILLDEPTVGVDPQSRAFLLDTVRQLASDGIGVIYTSHYMEEVESLASRVVIIDHGKVLRSGLLIELLAQGQAILKFVQTGLTDETVKNIMQVHGQLQSSEQVLLHSNTTASLALSALEAAGARIEHAEFGRFNLDQLFMQLTHRSLRDQ